MMVCGVFRGYMATILLSTLLSAGQAEVTVDSLLDEMTDLGRLTRMPEPYYVTRQFSSYDRAAQSPGDGWFANADAGHYLRVEEKDVRQEYVMMDAEGPGAIVRIWSATPAGTLKVYIDGEAFPSTFGTGTEDYYGYAWCSTELFTHAYHNQVHADKPDNYGDVCVSRFHILDDMPFKRRFRFDLENWHIRTDTTTTRAAVSFWYGSPEGEASFTPPTTEDVLIERMPPYVIFKVPGVELTDEIDLGEFDLQKGPNRLTVEITGANPQATKNYVFGLDYIRLQVMPEAR